MNKRVIKYFSQLKVLIIFLASIYALVQYEKINYLSQEANCTANEILVMNGTCVPNDLNPPNQSATIGNNFTIFWQFLNDQTIDIMIIYNWTGWFGLGFGNSMFNTSMVNANILQSNQTINKTSLWLQDLYSTKEGRPHNATIQNITLKGYSIQENQTIFKFNRPQVCSNTSVASILPNQTYVWCYAFGPNLTMNYHHSNRSTFGIYLGPPGSCQPNQFLYNGQCVTNDLNPTNASVSLMNGQIQLYWQFQNQMLPPSIDFLLIYNWSSWFGLGFGQNMINTDLVAANIDGTNILLQDLYSTHPGYPNNYQNQNLTLLGQNVQNNQTMVKFRRPQNTGNQQDKILVENQSYQFCMAYSNSPLMQFHTTAFTFLITLVDNGNSQGQIVCNDEQILVMNGSCVSNDLIPPAAYMQVGNNFTIYWEFQNDQSVDIMIIYNWTGWFGLGFGSSMTNISLVAANILQSNLTANGTQLYLQDLYATKNGRPQNSTSQNLTLKGYSIQNNQTIFKFNRPEISNNQTVTQILPNQSYIWCYAFGPNMTMNYHYSNRSTFGIYLGPPHTCAPGYFLYNGQCVINDLNVTNASISLQNGQIKLYWQFQNQMQPPSVDFLIIYNWQSWIGLGFGPNMYNTDMLSVNINGNNIILQDLYAVSPGTPNNYQNQKLNLLGQSVQNNQTQVKFRRPQNTGFNQDKVITENSTYQFCMAYSNSLVMQQHTTAFTFTVQLVSSGQQQTCILGDGLMQWHKNFLFWGWGIAVDVAIMIARFCKLMPFYIELHAVLLDLLCIGTFILEFMVVYQNRCNLKLSNIQNPDIETHLIMGLTFAGLVLIQIVLGGITRYKIHNKNPHQQSLNIKLFKQIHFVSGVLVYLVGKAQLFTGNYLAQGETNLGLLQAGVLLIIMITLRIILEVINYLQPQYIQNLIKGKKKFQNFQPQIEQNPQSLEGDNKLNSSNQILNENLLPMEQQNETNLLQYLKEGMPARKIKNILPNIEYVIFNNQVCIIDGFVHPGGQFIKMNIIGREVDRFIYGGHSLEILSKKNVYTHSQFVSCYFNRKCIGTLNLSFFVKSQGIQEEANQIMDKEHHQSKPSLNTELWVPDSNFSNNITWLCVQATSISNTVSKFIFQCSVDVQLVNYIPGVQWLGRHFTIRSRNQNWKDVKRIYTVMLCYQEDNFQLRDRIIQYWKAGFQNQSDILQPQLYNGYSKTFCLMVKKYNYPKAFSQYLHQNWNKDQFYLEGPHGLSMQLTSQSQGKHLIIAGGTGIFPFFDLFDFLIKKSVYEILKKQAKSTDANDFDFLKLRLGESLNNASFHLIASFNNQDEFYGKDIIKPLYLINKEYGLNIFDAVIRFSDDSFDQDLKTFHKQLKGKDLLEAISSNSNQNKEIMLDEVEVVYLCGPPSMMQSIYNDLQNSGIDEKKIIFV